MPPLSDKATASVGIVRRALRRARQESVAGWARRKGYQPATARAAIRRWAWRPEQVPHGGISRSLLADLHADLPADAHAELAALSHGNRWER